MIEFAIMIPDKKDIIENVIKFNIIVKFIFDYCLKDGLMHIAFVGNIFPDIHLSLSLTLMQDLNVLSVPM